jgi:hypothetical protein
LFSLWLDGRALIRRTGDGEGGRFKR